MLIDLPLNLFLLESSPIFCRQMAWIKNQIQREVYVSVMLGVRVRTKRANHPIAIEANEGIMATKSRNVELWPARLTRPRVGLAPTRAAGLKERSRLTKAMRPNVELYR